MPPAPFPVVEGYVIHEFIGRGSSGMVWRATQDGTMREVALKVLAPWQAHGLAPLRFEREAEIAASLEHEAIARIFGAGECAAGPWLAMELVEGPPADVWIAETHPSLRQRVAFFQQVCAGMSHAHQRGVIHRDLKPGNLLVTPAGEPKIVDFGLARRTTTSSLEVSLTREGDCLGTLAWMPPEQATGQWAHVDALSDVHALGAILFSLVTGSAPIDSRLPAAVQLASAQAGDRRRLREVDPAAPRDLEAVVARCLAPVKAERYQSVAELEADVSRWLAGDPVQAPVGAPLYWLRKKARRHWPVVATGVVGVLSVLGLATGYLLGKDRVEAEKRAALRREADQKARTLHEAQELVTQLLVEMRPRFEQAGHPEWIEEAEQRVAAFPWDESGAGAYDSRRFRGRSAVVLGDILASKGQWANALDAYHDAINHLKTLVPENPEVPIFREDLVRARIGESKALIRLGFHKEAYGAAQRVLTLTDPAAGHPASPALTAGLVDAVCQLGETTLRLPARAAESLEVARRTLGQIAQDPTADTLPPIQAEWQARLGLWIARLSAQTESPEVAKAAAASAESAARQLATMTDQGEVSGRLLASALVAVANSALKEGEADRARASLNEATLLLGRRTAPPGLSDAPQLELAAAWERCGAHMAIHADAQSALDANDQAIDIWSRVGKSSPSSEGLAALSRLCLANTRLARQQRIPPKTARYARLTIRKFSLGPKKTGGLASVALDTIEAAFIMIDEGAPTRPGERTWREFIQDAHRWLEETKPRMTKESVDRRAGLAPRIQAILSAG